MVKYYTAYGLKIKSEIDLPELKQVDSTEFDTSVVYGDVPKEIKNPTKKGVAFQAKENEFLLNVKDVADFYVINGKEIVVSKNENASDSEVNLFLLGSAFGAVIFQKRKIPFHGSSVIINDQAVIVSGVSGVGKSTIVANLVRMSYPLLSDDVTVLESENNNIIASFGFPQVKLWLDSLEQMKIESTNLKKIRPQLEKYKYPIFNFIEDKKVVSSVFIIKRKNTEGVEIEEIKGSEKFKILSANTYRKQFVEALNVKNEHFKIIAGMASKVNLYVIQRPNIHNTIDEISNLIIKTVSEK
jgi:hypothetical protein